MLSLRHARAVGLTALVMLLVGIGATAGLGVAGWAVGLTFGAVLTAALSGALLRAGRDGAGPADLVTLSRGLLACGVAALTVDSLLGDHVTLPLLALAVPALVLDAVDGWVARRTATATELGGRLDGEVDAFLMLVLSVYVAPSVGWWVLAAGLARYAFALADWWLPWMRRQLEYRYWRKVVTAAAGIGLTVAASGLFPHPVTVGVLVVVLLLLAESFGRDVWWLWRRRSEPGAGRSRVVVAPGVATRAATVVGLLLVWFALLAPNQPQGLVPVAFLRIPAEAVVVAGLALVLPGRAVRAMAVAVGSLLGVLAVLKILDLGTFAVLDRPFNVVTDRGQLGSGVGFVRDSVGMWAAVGTVVGALLLAAGVVVGVTLAVRRLCRSVKGHPRVGRRALAALSVAWVVCALTGAQVAPAGDVASADAVQLAAGKVRATAAALRDQERFDEAVADDPLRATGADLAGLRGKDVLVVFVESYGRIAVEGPESTQVQELLDAKTTHLRASGFTARSAFLTSPTFGGSSWLAHATLMSGVWVDNQWRYERLLSGDRATLTSAFARAGWRTVAVLPSNRRAWPEGKAFYRFDQVYDRSTLGYAGPKFGFSAMPDQYALSAFERRELAPPRRSPVMAEVDLTSSHGPWAPLPTTVDWDALGDGSVFHGIEAEAVTVKELWSDRRDVPSAFRASIAYSLGSLISFVETYGNDDLVLVMLGDHQPSTIVSGFGGQRDVPVTVIAHDRTVIDRLSAWGWQDGLRPGANAPVWRMDAFRDRFVAAFSEVSPGSGRGRP